MTSDALEALYGGAAGGGKSDALLMAALQYVEVPNYAALIVRRTYQQLIQPDMIVPRSQSWLAGTDARYHKGEMMWTFPSGAVLKFGHLQYEDDKYNYQGGAYDYIAFDELTQFTESMYRYLFSRLRRGADAKTPPRMRAGTNPGGQGHQWVKRRFIDEASDGRVFVPAQLDDNPHLDQEQYEHALAQLDPITHAQLRNGDWDAVQTGGWFERTWFKVAEDVPPGAQWVRYWDFAASPKTAETDPDWTAGALVARHEGVWYIADIVHLRATPHDVERRVRLEAEQDGRDVPIWIEQEPGASGVMTVDHYQRHVLPGWSVYADKPTGPKDVRARPVSAAAQAGNVRLVRGSWLSAFLDEAEAFPFGAHDDMIDAVSGAFKSVDSAIAPMMALIG